LPSTDDSVSVNLIHTAVYGQNRAKAKKYPCVIVLKCC